jgi:hypothetical protein
MRFIRVAWLDELGWNEMVHLLQNPVLIETQLRRVEKDDGGIQKRIRLELFHKKEAERKITRIQDDLLNDDSIFTKKEAIGKIEELRVIIQRANTEIERLQSIVQVAKQSQETVEATKRALEKLRGTNLKTASFDNKAELVAKRGIKIYPSEDLTYIRIFCGLKITEPQKVSCQKISMASPKLYKR